MKIVTSFTIFNDAVGTRLSATYSEVNDEGIIISDNKRVDRLLTDRIALQNATALKEFVQEVIDGLD